MDILVINSDLQERSVIQQVLEQSRQKVTFVDNPEEALKLPKESHFRLIIADETQQVDSIHQFIQTIRSTPNPAGHTYILLLVSKNQTEALPTKVNEGADDYLYKPVNPQELSVRVAVGIRILSMGDTLAQAHQQLENLALYDSLTGFMNRQAFSKVAQGELERARRSSGDISVIALEIENIKAIIDEHGNDVGDKAIKSVAEIIRNKSRPYDCVGRWTHDQFTIAISSVVSTDAEKIINRIVTGTQNREFPLSDGTKFKVKLSAGIAYTQNINPYADIESLIQSAVQAMDNSKQYMDEDIGIVFI